MLTILASIRSYLHTYWPFLLAALSGFIGFSPWINALLYNLKWPYVFWAMCVFWSPLRFAFSILFWILAICFFIIGRNYTSGEFASGAGRPEAPKIGPIFRYQDDPLDRQAATETAFPKNVSSRSSSVSAPFKILLGIALTALVLCTCPGSLLIAQTGTDKDSASYQGHVYHLALEEKRGVVKGEGIAITFAFTVSQCDMSGMFCHAFDDGICGQGFYYDGLPSSYVNEAFAHLEIDSARSQLVVLCGYEPQKFTYPLT